MSYTNDQRYERLDCVKIDCKEKKELYPSIHVSISFNVLVSINKKYLYIYIY